VDKGLAVSGDRADRVLVARGLFASRTAAQAAIEAGLVTADGVRVTKASQTIAQGAKIEATPAHPYVSRGGVKLAAALDHFAVDPRRKVCLDVGSSTGGFTEVLLLRGACRVYAVDVGTKQMHKSLAHRDDVVPLESTDIRNLTPGDFSAPPELIAIDVSFISLKLVLPVVTALAASGATLIALVKPQFEAGRKALRKGVVRDPEIHAAVCADVSAAAQELGWRVRGMIESPIEGGDGNREFLLCAHQGVAGS
jgi:23S rRNA (cytidine1920-2'-O)/16S rRNA (cytidine1409-2'-O)-methyltransferase